MSDDGAGGGSWDPDLYDGGHDYVFEYGEDVVALLDPEPGEGILDLGCGTGHLTAAIAAAVGDDGTVVGIDSAPEMIAEAREAHPGIEFAVADATEFEADALDAVDEPFDAVFSNAALHWIQDQAAVTAQVFDALRPGGRYVAELGGSGNVATIVEATVAERRARGDDPANPFYFPTISEHAAVLEDVGFETRTARLFDRPTELDGGESGLANWLAMFGDSLLAGLDEEERADVVAGVEDRVRENLWDPEREAWIADYRRLRFEAVRPA